MQLENKMETIYEILIKGWGEYEEAWYPHNQGPDIFKLKEKVFENWDTQANYKIVDLETRSVVEEGVVNEGIF
jgi:hypothetical protein